MSQSIQELAHEISKTPAGASADPNDNWLLAEIVVNSGRQKSARKAVFLLIEAGLSIPQSKETLLFLLEGDLSDEELLSAIEWLLSKNTGLNLTDDDIHSLTNRIVEHLIEHHKDQLSAKGGDKDRLRRYVEPVVIGLATSGFYDGIVQLFKYFSQGAGADGGKQLEGIAEETGARLLEGFTRRKVQIEAELIESSLEFTIFADTSKEKGLIFTPTLHTIAFIAAKGVCE